MLDETFIQKIIDLADTKIITVNGEDFTTNKVYRKEQPEAAAIVIHTLSGMVDYLDKIAPAEATEEFINPDSSMEKCLQDVFFHVKDVDKVSLVSMLFGTKQRETFISSQAYPIPHRFGHFQGVEEFIINLQSMFVQDETTEAILKIVGNLSSYEESNHADDGISQKVTARTGVTRVEVVSLPNPVTLRPFRTFPEIEQPASKFILRIRNEKGDQPSCALFESDGGAWKHEAILNIRDYLAANASNKAVNIVA